MRSSILAGAFVAFALVVACGGKVADGAPVGVASCTTSNPQGTSCSTAGDECATTLTSCDGTSAASTCYCTGQRLWSCDIAETACVCMPGGTCSAAHPTCSTRLQADCGWWSDVTCTCEGGQYTCAVPSCGEGACMQGGACSAGTCISGGAGTCYCDQGTWQCGGVFDAGGVGTD